MKTKKILIALSFAIFTSLSLSATAISENGKVEPDSINHRINIRVDQDNQVILRAACCENQKWVNFVLKVYSDKGEMVYGSSIHKKGGIYKAFDMKNLPEGKYSFEVYKGLKKVYSKEVLKTSDIASAADGSKKTIVHEL